MSDPISNLRKNFRAIVLLYSYQKVVDAVALRATVHEIIWGETVTEDKLQRMIHEELGIEWEPVSLLPVAPVTED
jgi:hypothetical protein